MQIKEAAAICGLTEKAIRLYEAKGLISPAITEINGRKFRDYSEDDIRTLKTIAGLRQSYFSMEQIAGMQSDPASIPAIFEAYKQDMAAQCSTLETLLARMETVDANALSSPAALAGVLSGCSLPAAETPALSGGTDAADDALPDDSPAMPYENNSVPDAHIRVWDEETPPELRDAAHRQSRAYVEQWEREYEMELFWGKLIRRVLIPIAAVVCLALALYNIPYTEDIAVSYQGYALKTSPTLWQQAADALGRVPLTEEMLDALDPTSLPVVEDASPVSLHLRGRVYRYLFREDCYIGSIVSDDYKVDLSGMQISDALTAEEIRQRYNRYRIPLDGTPRHLESLMSPVYPKSEDGENVYFIAVDGIPGSGEETVIFEVGSMQIDLDTVHPAETAPNTFAVFPAESPAVASEKFWDILWRVYQEDYLAFLEEQRETEVQ